MTAGIPRFERKTAFRVNKAGLPAQPVSSGAEVTVNFSTAVYDLGSNFNLATDRYVAPLDGIYVFSGAVELNAQGSGAGRVLLRINTDFTEVIRGMDLTVRDFVSGDFNVFTISGQTFLSQGDTVRLLCFVVSGPVQNINTDLNTTRFEGFRIQSESRTILGG